jgi:hypothetical protein
MISTSLVIGSVNVSVHRSLPRAITVREHFSLLLGLANYGMVVNVWMLHVIDPFSLTLSSSAWCF